MTYTDQDVERVVEALCTAEYDHEYWLSLQDGAANAPDAFAYQREINRYLVMARAALESMEREPLEDVLSPHEPMSVYLEPLYSGEIGARGCIDTWIAKVQVWDYANQTTETLTGRGDTIDESIRAAIAAAKGEE